MKENARGNILVMDDDEAMRDYIACFLRQAGHSVSLCKDGNEGLRMFGQEIYDLVITDIMMPGKDGLCAMIEMEKVNAAVPILAISGADMKDALLDAADIFGAVHTLKKPFTKEELLWSVADILFTVALRA
jgi:DNA-binding response OmpR family regulator